MSNKKLTHKYYTERKKIHDEDAIKQTYDRDKYLLYTCGGGILLCIQLLGKTELFNEGSRYLFLILGILILGGALALLNQCLSVVISNKYSKNYDEFYKNHHGKEFKNITECEEKKLQSNFYEKVHLFVNWIIMGLLILIVIISIVFTYSNF